MARVSFDSENYSVGLDRIMGNVAGRPGARASAPTVAVHGQFVGLVFDSGRIVIGSRCGMVVFDMVLP